MYESKERVFQSRKTRPLVLFYYACRKQPESDRERFKKGERRPRELFRGGLFVFVSVSFGSVQAYLTDSVCLRPLQQPVDSKRSDSWIRCHRVVVVFVVDFRLCMQIKPGLD